MNDSNENIEEIDVSNVDWNHLNPKQFSELEKQFQEKQKLMKKANRKKTRSSGFITVKIQNKNYLIKETLFQRLKGLKNAKSKEKLINKIILENNPILEL